MRHSVVVLLFVALVAAYTAGADAFTKCGEKFCPFDGAVCCGSGVCCPMGYYCSPAPTKCLKENQSGPLSDEGSISVEDVPQASTVNAVEAAMHEYYASKTESEVEEKGVEDLEAALQKESGVPSSASTSSVEAEVVNEEGTGLPNQKVEAGAEKTEVTGEEPTAGGGCDGPAEYCELKAKVDAAVKGGLDGSDPDAMQSLQYLETRLKMLVEGASQEDHYRVAYEFIHVTRDPTVRTADYEGDLENPQHTDATV